MGSSMAADERQRIQRELCGWLLEYWREWKLGKENEGTGTLFSVLQVEHIKSLYG